VQQWQGYTCEEGAGCDRTTTVHQKQPVFFSLPSATGNDPKYFFQKMGLHPQEVKDMLVGMMQLFIDHKAALLQALAAGGEGYGLELIDRVKQQTNGAITLLQGRVYPALRELEQEGFVKSYESDPLPERGGRPRRYYKLTAEGRRAATAQRNAASSLFQLGWEGR